MTQRNRSKLLQKKDKCYIFQKSVISTLEPIEAFLYLKSIVLMPVHADVCIGFKNSKPIVCF